MAIILVTDSLFINDKEHIKQINQLKQHGHRIERLDKSCATEEELILEIEKIEKRVKGKIEGYIIGGIEQVTDRVIDAASGLKAIVFTGAGYKEHIPAYEMATKKGIAIANAPGGNAASVAEFTVCMILSMTRQIFSLGHAGNMSFKTTQMLTNKAIGIVGLGHVGVLVAKQLKALGVNDVAYYSPRRKYHFEGGLGIHYLPLDEIFRHRDIITLHASKDAGEAYVNKSLISLMKDNSLLVNASYPGAVDEQALLSRLKEKEKNISAIFDAPPKLDEFNKLPNTNWYSSKQQAAYNTVEANDTVSAMAITSIVNLLDSGNDLFRVNNTPT